MCEIIILSLRIYSYKKLYFFFLSIILADNCAAYLIFAATGGLAFDVCRFRRSRRCYGQKKKRVEKKDGIQRDRCYGEGGEKNDEIQYCNTNYRIRLLYY